MYSSHFNTQGRTELYSKNLDVQLISLNFFLNNYKIIKLIYVIKIVYFDFVIIGYSISFLFLITFFSLTFFLVLCRILDALLLWYLNLFQISLAFDVYFISIFITLLLLVEPVWYFIHLLQLCLNHLILLFPLWVLKNEEPFWISNETKLIFTWKA